MQKHKAFTLIELAIVLLVIGILAGLMLRNVGMYGIQARDAKRKGDLRNLSVNLVQYNSTQGYYPSSTNLMNALRSIGISNFPSTPRAGEYYDYWACTTTGVTGYNHFILRTRLEQSTSSNPRLYDDSYNSTTPPLGWSCDSGIRFSGNSTGGSAGTVNCDANQNYYCIAQ